MKKNTINLSFVLLALLFGITPIRAQYNQEAKIVSDNREEAAEFGTAVAILDSYAVVGAPRENIASGSVYIYHKDANGDWSFVQSVSARSEEHTSELQSRPHLVCRLLLEKKKKKKYLPFLIY